MADPRFFNRAGPFSLADIAAVAGASPVPGVDPDRMIDDVADLDSAGTRALSFLANSKYRDALQRSRAGACLIGEAALGFVPNGMAALIAAQPYRAFGLAARLFYPEALDGPAAEPDAPPLHPTAKIGQGCSIAPGAVIGAKAEIGDGCRIGGNAVIGPGVVIGAQSRIGANAVISHALISQGVAIYPGAAIGQDGFGFHMSAEGHIRIPQLGRVIVEDGCEIGANTTVDRGALGDTVIGRGTMIDNLVHIAHNVRIGALCVIAGQCGISGSTVLEDGVVLAGQVGIAGHIRIGRGAQIGAKSGILQDVPPGARIMGYPAVPLRQFFRQAIARKQASGKDS